MNMNDHAQSQTLASCPFCGGDPEFERHGTNRQSSIIACTDCGARIEANETHHSNGNAWNRRVPPTGTVAFTRKDLETFLANCLSERGFEETRTLMLDRNASTYEFNKIFPEHNLKAQVPNQPPKE